MFNFSVVNLVVLIQKSSRAMLPVCGQSQKGLNLISEELKSVLSDTFFFGTQSKEILTLTL